LQVVSGPIQLQWTVVIEVINKRIGGRVLLLSIEAVTLPCHGVCYGLSASGNSKITSLRFK
jgi:hypothetical protein